MPGTGLALGPFGNPDGSLEDFTVSGRFIDFSQAAAVSGIGMAENNLRKRVIFGRKGSGKTLYLRRQKAWAESQSDVFVYDQKTDLPPTEVVRKLSVLFDAETKTNQWMQIWRRALFLALASIYYCNNDQLSPLLMRFSPGRCYKTGDFKRIFQPLFSFGEAPETVFTALTAIYRRNSGRQQLLDYLINPLWNSLEEIVFRDMRNSPPIIMYIDAIDEEFRHSPVVWMDCQKALFYTVVRLMREPGSSNRLHVIVAARDIVYSSMSESEHFTRYVTDDHISTLDWDKGTTERFLRAKVQRLPERYFDKGTAPDYRTLESWLGMDKIENPSRGIVEPISDYILRHTRMLPRDVVVMGNLLVQQQERCRMEQKEFTPGRFRKTVGRAAAIFAKETLNQCANHFCSAGMSRRHLNRAYFMRDEDVELSAEDAGRAIRALIRQIGKDVFTLPELRSAMKKLGFLDSGNDKDSEFIRFRIDSILWQNAAIAYARQQGPDLKWRFNWSTIVESLTLPNADLYGFHSSFIDEFNIEIASKLPVH